MFRCHIYVTCLVQYIDTFYGEIHVVPSRALLGACAYNSTGRKYAPISEMRLIMNILIMTFLE